MQTVSSEELYKQVWQRPLMKVAADYSITGTALKKICDRHEIPTPERGYWAKLAYGKPVSHPSLPIASEDRLNQVQIVGANYPALPQKVTEAKARVRDKLAESRDREAPYSVGSYDTADDAVRGIPSLAATLRAIQKDRPDHEGFVAAKGRGVVPLRVAPASVDRSILLLAQFFSLADSQGFKPKATAEALVLVVDGETIGFSLEAPADRTPHQPTTAELKEQARYAGWGMSREPWSKYDYFPSERLSIVIQANAYSGLRKTFSDRQTKPLE